MSKTIRVQWEYPDFAYSLGDENYEDFEVDDDAGMLGSAIYSFLTFLKAWLDDRKW